ncbi:MAG: uncharacterized protein QOE70_5684 [Chthoniobacter sp.]|jgi:uncharacterized protein YceH (UPF0502 family)|nr:uncharacterized protein [Chthoniobacter sp.]
MPYDLNAVETRILGCLLEKERLTPENYPLSLNSLVAACNQSTNREPVASYDEKFVEEGVNALRARKLATVIFGAGSRVQKYRHKLLEHYNLDEAEVALLCVLLLRGPQTPGELRIRTERMHPSATLESVEARLEALAQGDSPLVKALPPRPGQKEKRYVQLLSAESLAPEMDRETPDATSDRQPVKTEPGRIAGLEQEVAQLKAEMQQLKDEFGAFRKQFE